MYKVMTVLFTLIHTRNSAIIGSLHQYFISTPANMTVNSGSHARLSCRVGNLVGTCEWTRDGFSLGTDRNLGGYPRYLMPGQRQDICDLSIDPVLPIDEGLYQCQVSGGHGVPPIASSPVSLSVNSEPGKPYIMQAMEEEMMEVQEGEEVKLQCESQGGRPPAEIQWWDGEGRRIVSDVTEHVRKMEDTNMFKTVSTLRFTPSMGQHVKCSAHNDAFPVIRKSHPLWILIKGQPNEEEIELGEGDSVIVNCFDKGIKDDMIFKWFINDIEIPDESNNALEIEKFSKSYDKTRVKCSVKDSNGDDESVRIVKLVHKPNQKIEPRALHKTDNGEQRSKTNNQIIGDNKKKSLFTCIVEESEEAKPKYVWIDGKLRNVITDENGDTADHNKKYKCKVIPQGNKKINRMSTDMKKISKTMRKFSKTLVQMISPPIT